MFDTYSDLLTIKDMQNALGVGRTTAYRLINDGTIKHLRIGSLIKIPKSFLMEFCKGSCYTGSVVANQPS